MHVTIRKRRHCLKPVPGGRCLLAVKKEDADQEAVFFMARVLFGVNTPEGPPPPPTPLPVPPPKQKGCTILLLFQIGFHLHNHQDLKLKCCRVMGQKLRYGRPWTRALPGTHKWLAQSQNTSNSSEFHYLMLAQSCMSGVDCCFIGLTHPAAYTRARVPLTFGHVHRPLP